MRELGQSADDAVGRVDAFGRVIAWDEGCERIYGYRADEVIGRPFPAVDIAGPDPEHGLSIAARAMSGETVSAHAVPRRRKDGTTVVIDVRLAPVRDDTGAIVGVTALAREASPAAR